MADWGGGIFCRDAPRVQLFAIAALDGRIMRRRRPIIKAPNSCQLLSTKGVKGNM